ncbi:MAG TPA: Ig-like domain-containing protein, partial [Isosphaeraceae bacterium]|nr:Ig-like domain-containing protein [Isosphaeraceae bacterium]
DITGPGISHSGDFSVHEWYMVNVMPALGDGQPGISGPLLTAQVAPESGHGPVYDSNIGLARPRERTVVSLRQPTFVGTTEPGASVTLAAREAGSGTLSKLGETTADATGAWSITTPRRLPNGQVRLVVLGSVSARPMPSTVRSIPVVRMGTVLINVPKVRPEVVRR